MTRERLRAWRGTTSVVRRLAVALTLIVGAATLLVVILLATAARRGEEAEVRRNVVSSAAVVAHLLEPALWDLDLDRAAALGEAFAQDPRVARLTIDEISGDRREIRRVAASDTISSTAAITHAGRRIGSVTLVFSRALYRARAAQQARQAIAMGGAVLLVALLAVRLLLGRLLSRPLEALSATVTRYATGDYERPRPAVPYAEFAPFWDVLDRMAARIRAQLDERTRAERRAEQSRRMLALVIDAVPQAIFWKDRGGVYLGANTVFARWTGLPSPDAVLGLTDDALPHADGAASGARREIVHEMTLADGRRRWIETTVIPLADERGETIGVLGVSQDVTDRRAEAERVDRMRHAQKLEAIGQLAGGVAHDFNNIVTGIQLQLELLETEHHLTAPVQAVVRDVRTSADRAAYVARQLLTFGRRQSMTLRRVELGAVVAEQLRMLAPLLGKQVTVRHEPAATPLPADADAAMIEQVLTNLCLNARDAMPDGTITVRMRRVEVDAALARAHAGARAGAHAALEVVDTGCGMSEETMARIFEPFFTTKGIGEGTGLGLATSHGIVVQHRGWIEVSSHVGAGTTFRVFLPLAEDHGDGLTTASDVAPPGANTRPRASGILVAGGNGPAARTAARALRRLGHAVHEVRDLPEALRTLRDRGDDLTLALIDVAELGSRGERPAASLLREAARGVEIVWMTDLASMAGHAEPRERVLLKPFTLAELQTVVDAVGRRDRARAR